MYGATAFQRQNMQLMHLFPKGLILKISQQNLRVVGRGHLHSTGKMAPRVYPVLKHREKI